MKASKIFKSIYQIILRCKKRIIIITSLIIIMTLHLSATTYYISLDGNDTNSGLTPLNSWRTITYAASSASPVSQGDIVFIKAGDYGNETIIFETDGTDTNPITFEGYQFVPGDNPDLEWEYGDNLNANIMPLLDGGDRTTGTGITLGSREYINVNNIQIRNYERGLYAWNAHNIKVDNIISMYFGDINSSYHGKGIVFGPLASNNTVENCVVYNACAEGLSIIGDNHYVKGCRVYSDDNSTGHQSAMDYYIHVNGNSNTIENCYVERVGDIDHGGHGIGLKGDCENNMILNCVAKGFSLYGFNVRHRGVINNTFEHCTAIGCGFAVRDGASYNTFKNCTSIDANKAIVFFDTAEDGGAQYTGRHNVFENCIIQNTLEDVIDFHYYSLPSICDNNTFVNCVFDGGNYLFNCDRENQDNKLINCIVTNVSNYYRTQQHQGTAYPLNVDISYSNFWNNGFVAPTGVSISTFDPDFVDLSNKDYHLTSTSLCIDAGDPDADISDYEKDYDGNYRIRDAIIDMGAYEYQSGGITIQNTIAENNTVATEFTDAGAELQFIGNHNETIINATKYDSDPGIVGNLPTGVEHISTDRYWNLYSTEGDVGNYNVTFDLSGVSSIQNFNTLHILKRNNSSSSWQDVVSDLGFTLTYNNPYITVNNLTAFSDFGIGGGSDNTLPVELSSFTAQFIGSSPILCWTTQSETGNAGWNVYRGDYRDAFINGDAIQINPVLIEGSGTTSISTDYTFVDQYDVIAGNEYWYILESVDYSGEAHIHGSVYLIIPEEGTISELPQQTLLNGNYPNPFNPNTTISFMVKENETAHLSIFNIKGQKIENIRCEAGVYKYLWDASSYASGVYLYKLKTESFSEIRKMILLK